MPKISKTSVDAAQPQAKPYFIWDDRLSGFGVMILPSGVKSYCYQFRTPEGRSRRLTIGKHGDWTPDLARAEAEKARDGVKTGLDPADAKRERREAPTVADILDAYLASERFKSKAPSTQSIDRGRIARHLKPLLGKRFAKELTPETIKRAMADIRAGKTATSIKTGKRGLARVKGGDMAARDSIGLLRAALNWAVSEDLIASNPAATVKLAASPVRETILEDQDAYGRLFRTLEAMESEKRLRPAVADAIRVIALTGARRGEISGLLWKHVDLRKGAITLPPASHKTGRKTGKPRVIGLPAAAQAIIAKQPSGKPDDLVFAPAHGDKPLSLSKPWRSIRVAAKLPDGIGLHGLRHSLASHMAMAGAAAAEIMTALGHRQLSTAQRYVHWAQDARQALAEKAASVVIAGLEQNSQSVSAQLVKYPRTER